MKRTTLMLAGTALAAGALVGCSNDGGTTSTTTSTATTSTTPTGTGPGSMMGQPPSNAAGAGLTARPTGTTGTATAGTVKNSWDVIKDKTNTALVASAAQTNVKPVKDGTPAPGGLRADPFESMIKVVVPEIPAYTLAIPSRLASAYRPPAPPIEDRIDRVPLIPVPRRVAGVMYNGAITAILETGEASSGSVQHDVIRPGSVVRYGIEGMPDLTVESITMSALILRAPDGRTVEVKLSGLPPAVADSLRAQFGSGGGGANPGFPGGGMPGAPGGGAAGEKGGGGVRDF